MAFDRQEAIIMGAGIILMLYLITKEKKDEPELVVTLPSGRKPPADVKAQKYLQSDDDQMRLRLTSNYQELLEIRDDFNKMVEGFDVQQAIADAVLPSSPPIEERARDHARRLDSLVLRSNNLFDDAPRRLSDRAIGPFRELQKQLEQYLNIILQIADHKPVVHISRSIKVSRRIGNRLHIFL